MLDKPQSIELVRHIQRMLHAAKTGHIDHDAAIHLCDFAPLAGESITRARWREDENAIGVMVKHEPLSNPPVENDRLIDPLFFAAVLLMCLAGGNIIVESTRANGKLYYYLRYEHPHDKSEDKRIYLIRVIADAPPNQAVRFIGDYHSLCLRNLALGAPAPRMKDPKLGRADAIKLARELYEANHPAGLEYLSPEGFEAFLTEVLTTATAYHGPRDEAA